MTTKEILERAKVLVEKYPHDLRRAAKILAVEAGITTSLALYTLREVMLRSLGI